MITIEQMVQREVLCCMSSLVSTLAKMSGYPLSAQYVSRETKSECDALFEQAAELAAPVLDYEEAAVQEGWTGPHEDQFTVIYFKNQTESEQNTTWAVPTWEALCRDFDIDPYEWEVYEHWAVSQRLADKLIAQGERVDTDFAGLNIWARTTTGQAISMDGCIQRIHADMMAPAGSRRMKCIQQTATRQAPPVDGKPAWYGLYWQDEQWNYVCNANGDCIAYTSPEYAEQAAEYTRAK